ncbi:iron ABC transporter permease [Pseudorhodobacter turbinis]|uniref:Iron ABC transporter permease n=1 Tax=Pseudorhodobacter turbinis TaxID=2500533 RepID=A0A4P8EFW5_9RHOB|nr:iron ABC transporter permease [Pseudorhodobacter turbinis]QCO55758.1 iron ABC transporter permease [Pseudorhodobacter turbinis]
MRASIWLTLALAISLMASLSVGDQRIPALSVLGALVGADSTPITNGFIVIELRLPRAILGALVGAALAVAGAATQALIRNPLAESGLLGINSGAALAATIVIVQADNLPESLLPLFAVGGALAMSAAIYALAWRAGTNTLRLILVGIGLGALAGAAASFLSVFGPVAQAQRAMVWLAGSLNDARWVKSLWLLAGGLPAVGVLWLMKHDLDLISLGDTTARALGQRVHMVRGIAVFAAAGLAGVAVAAAGPIAFVGLVAPHVARRVVGAGHARLIPAAALTGAVMVVLADLFARRVFAPGQLPVGLATALLGAPFFGYILWKKRHD